MDVLAGRKTPGSGGVGPPPALPADRYLLVPFRGLLSETEAGLRGGAFLLGGVAARVGVEAWWGFVVGGVGEA
jgi:hypothetical protein